MIRFSAAGSDMWNLVFIGAVHVRERWRESALAKTKPARRR